MAVTLLDLNANPFQAAASAAETLIVDELPSETTLSLKFDQLVTIIIALQTAPCTGSRDRPDENALRRLIRRAPKLENLRIIQQSAPEDSEKTSDRSLLGADRPNVDIKYISAHDLAAAFALSPQVSPAKAAIESWAATVASACEVRPALASLTRHPVVQASMEPPDPTHSDDRRIWRSKWKDIFRPFSLCIVAHTSADRAAGRGLHQGRA
ncbi:hypothetical protein K4K61_003380 [Colletotrichum sp. SAR11_59]|nr:hypothetical protein K4K61_003380 [Colletotrichum sp. SAR11_59]